MSDNDLWNMQISEEMVMRFDECGYPAPNGSTDSEDSSHLAGMLAVTEHPQAVDCRLYIADEYQEFFNGDIIFGGEYESYILKVYVRCKNSKYDFSRDQFTPLAAGLIKQGHASLVNTDYITGRDLLPPSVRGMVRIAQGKKPYFYQSIWLKLEIYWHSYLQPLEESNQLIALCSVYGDEYLKLWTKHNKLWKFSVLRYWSELDGAWRGEPELAEHIIKYVESKI